MNGSANPRIRPTGGVAALVATVALWSSFALTARSLGTSSLTAADATILRFGVPMAVLAPVIPRAIRALRNERPAAVALLLAGGLPHFLLFTFGAHLTSAALTGLLVPGTVPLFVSVIAYVTTRQRVGSTTMAALAAITAGVVGSAALVSTGASVFGVGLLLVAGFAWALYTLGLQRSSMEPLEMIAAVCGASCLGGLALAGTGAMPSALLAGSARMQDVVTIASVQGIGTGLVSTLCFRHAIRTLGAPAAAVGGAASPVLTAAMGVPLFGEDISIGLAAAMTLVVAGVVVYNLAPARSSECPGRRGRHGGERLCEGPDLPKTRVVQRAARPEDRHPDALRGRPGQGRSAKRSQPSRPPSTEIPATRRGHARRGRHASGDLGQPTPRMRFTNHR